MSEATTQEWVGRVTTLRENARAMILEVQALSLHAQANGLTEVITASIEVKAPALPGTSMPPDVALDLVSIFSDLLPWLEEPVREGGPKRLHVLFRKE